MLSNPHAGSDLAEPWEQGFAAGFLAPDQDLTAPSPLSVEAQGSYTEGIIAGKFSIRGMRVPPVSPPRRPGTWESVIEFAAEHIAEHILLEIAQRGIVVKAGAEAKAAFGLANATFLVISIAIFGPDRSEPFFEEGANRQLQRILQQLADTGTIAEGENVELFMAACDRQGHDLGEEDELLRQGFWHGRVFLSFEDAENEAIEHDHLPDTVVFRFQTAAPGMVEVIELSPA